MLEGGQPYRDAVERKPPLLFSLYEGVFRLAGPRNWVALHTVGILWSLATMALLYLLARRLFDPLTGWAAALMYGLFQAWGDYRNLALNGELLMNLPVVAALTLTLWPSRRPLRPELLLAGALIPVAFLLKQPSGIAALPLGLYLLRRDYREPRGWRVGTALLQAGMLTAGFVASFAVAGLLLWRQGILRDAIYWSITNHDTPLGPTTRIFWDKLFSNTAYFAVACAPLLFGAFASVKGGSEPGAWWEARRAERAALLWLLIVSAVGVAASGQFLFHYYLQFLPPLVLLAAPWFTAAWRGEFELHHLGIRAWPLNAVLLLFAVTFLMIDTAGLIRQRDPGLAPLWVRENSDPADRIYVWGQGDRQTGFYLDAERRPATRYIAPFPLTGHVFGGYPAAWGREYEDARMVPGAWDNLFVDFDSHPPQYIIDAEAVRPASRYSIRRYPRLWAYLDREFRLVRSEVDGLVYQRISSDSAAR